MAKNRLGPRHQGQDGYVEYDQLSFLASSSRRWILRIHEDITRGQRHEPGNVTYYFLNFLSSAYGLAVLDRMGGRTGIANLQALASAFHDNGPGIGASEIFFLLLMFQGLHASGAHPSS